MAPQPWWLSGLRHSVFSLKWECPSWTQVKIPLGEKLYGEIYMVANTPAITIPQKCAMSISELKGYLCSEK